MAKICVSGSKGKMGLRILELAKAEAGIEVAGVFDIGDDPEPLIAKCECLIEFTAPQATADHLELCEKHGKAIVIGTTGLSEAQEEKVALAAQKIPVVYSPNMSVGVNVLFKIVGEAAKALGHEYRVEIVEAHHVHKKDTPSGTAKELARIVKDVRGDARIPIESVREDEIVGEHTITFEGPLDVIELTHSAKTRDIFAKGALVAAKYIVQKKNGLFSMRDVLGL